MFNLFFYKLSNNYNVIMVIACDFTRNKKKHCNARNARAYV